MIGATMNEQEALARMVPPGKPRPHIWRRGVLQIHITRACDKQCFGCTQGSNLAGKNAYISTAEFEQACLSLKDYFGVVGVFGGNPCMHPKFDVLCEILRKHIPAEQRGLWSNKFFGHGAVCRETFNPAVSNLNCHLDHEAYLEMCRDWPEAKPYIKGMDSDSRHSPPFVAMKDVVADESKRWDMIANCDVNQHWSALVGVVPGKGLRAFFCELAYAQAALHADDPEWPDTGMPVEPGWWKRPMQDFAEQVRWHCHRCGVPLRRFGQLAVSGQHEEVSETHKDIYKPKDKNRRVELITVDAPSTPVLRRMTDYIENSSLPAPKPKPAPTPVAAPVAPVPAAPKPPEPKATEPQALPNLVPAQTPNIYVKRDLSQCLRALLVAVNYTDYLQLTLPRNRHHFESVTIVTSVADAAKVAPIAAANRANMVVTDVFYERNADFNKFAAVEQAFDQIGRHGWFALLDADVIWPKVIPPYRRELGYLYSPIRRLMFDATETVPDDEEWYRFPIHHNLIEWSGYTQIFHANDPHLGTPPWHDLNFGYAGGGDTLFQEKWEPARKIRPPFEVLHLGPTEQNWCGRSSRYLDGSEPPDAGKKHAYVHKLVRSRFAAGANCEKLI